MAYYSSQQNLDIYVNTILDCYSHSNLPFLGEKKRTLAAGIRAPGLEGHDRDGENDKSVTSYDSGKLTFISTAPYSRSLELTGVRVRSRTLAGPLKVHQCYLVQAHFEIYERKVL